MNNALIIMIKNPVKGQVKTRLAKDVGDEKALEIYLQLLEHTKNITQNIAADKFIFYSNVIERFDMFENTTFKKYTQCSGDLGVRMEYAFSIPFKNEYKQVVMIGADCYALLQKHIEEAFEKIKDNDFVFGPANDGGYYLIAMKKWNRWVFQNKHWSTEKLYAETKQEILSNKGKIHELEMLTDIDTAQDWNMRVKQ
jgi:hypothetical protein